MELNALRARVIDRLANELPEAVVHGAPDALRPAVLASAERVLGEESVLLDARERRALAFEITDALIGLGPVESLLRDPDVTDVLINGPGPVLVERSGRLVGTSVVLSSAEEIGRAHV